MRLFLYFLWVCNSTRLLGGLTAEGVDYGLECLNDYLFTITCSLNISADVTHPDSGSYWLEFEDYDEEQYKLKCVLERGVCVLDMSAARKFSFLDTDEFLISLYSCHHGNTSSVLLEESYMPVHHIRPVPPSDLSLSWATAEALFSWQSGYEPSSLLIENLQYQLRIQNTQHQHQPDVIHSLSVSVDVAFFAGHTSYSAAVRSQPNQGHYRGEWSQWGPVLRWTTATNHNVEAPDVWSLPGTLAFLCLLLPLLLCCIPLVRWSQRAFIPTPAPYFRDWDGDFKSWVVPLGTVGDLLQGEESLQIDSLSENANPATLQSPASYERLCVAVSNMGHTDLTVTPHSPVGSEVDSGCWLPDAMAMQQENVCCIDEYCILAHTCSVPTYTN